MSLTRGRRLLFGSRWRRIVLSPVLREATHKVRDAKNNERHMYEEVFRRLSLKQDGDDDRSDRNARALNTWTADADLLISDEIGVTTCAIPQVSLIEDVKAIDHIKQFLDLNGLLI